MSVEKRILVTGGSGFIGTNVVEHYSSMGVRVINLDLVPPRNSSHIPYWIKCDLMNREQMAHQLKEFKPTHVIHLAARTDLLGTSLQDYSLNIEGTQNLIEVMRSLQSLQRVIFASSRLVCRIGYVPKDDLDYCPPNFYGVSKVEFEKIIRKANCPFEWVIVRPTSIWGPWFDVPYKIFFDSISNGKFFYPGRYNPRKSFGYVGNTVYELDKLLFCPIDMVDKKTLYLCDYPPLVLQDWAEMIQVEMKSRCIKSLPFYILQLMALVGDFLVKIGMTFPLTTFRLNNLIADMVFDSTDLEKICGPLPFSVSDGVRATVRWLEAR
jgi:GlcNAc-P-P-Und epimerase